MDLTLGLVQGTHMSKAAMKSWLNAESQYRLRVQQAKEAADGSKFAEQEYEKWRTGNAPYWHLYVLYSQ